MGKKGFLPIITLLLLFIFLLPSIQAGDSGPSTCITNPWSGSSCSCNTKTSFSTSDSTVWGYYLQAGAVYSGTVGSSKWYFNYNYKSGCDKSVTIDTSPYSYYNGFCWYGPTHHTIDELESCSGGNPVGNWYYKFYLNGVEKGTASFTITCAGSCQPGNIQSCGYCGTQTCSYNSATNQCEWSSCQGQGVCSSSDPCCSSSCTYTPAGGYCGTKTCPSDEYYIAGTESPTSTNYCKLKDYDATCTKTCTGSSSSCPDCSCSYATTVKATCGTCKKVSSCTSSSQSCSNYLAGTSCGTDKECDSSGNCVAIQVNQDVDNDGYTATIYGGQDCNDNDAAIHPGVQELCDNKDNNCDGQIDEGCDCIDGTTKECGSSIGECKKGTQTCSNGKWSSCIGSIEPTTETCNNKDDDCDGKVDESLTESCGSATCTGTKTCSAGVWSSCSSKDKDCGICCKCSSTGTETYDSTQNADCLSTTCPLNNCGLGTCSKNILAIYPSSIPNTCSLLKQCTSNVCTATCETDSDKDTYSTSCGDCDDNNAAANPLIKELCDGIDNNCNKEIDEGCSCSKGSTQECGMNIGACKKGIQTCVSGIWSSCEGSVSPVDEICGNQIDDDCDGEVDEAFDQDGDNYKTCENDCNDTNLLINPAAQEVCDNLDNNCNSQIDESLARPCGSDAGECSVGAETCITGIWSGCTAILPATEICDGKDNDCDGEVDEGCSCNEGSVQSCGSNIGRCEAGIQTCTNGRWSSCEGAITPITEICDNEIDDNCNGIVDDCTKEKEIKEEVVIEQKGIALQQGASTCYNNIKDNGEEGIDCGGPCPAKCTTFQQAVQELFFFKKENKTLTSLCGNGKLDDGENCRSCEKDAICLVGQMCDLQGNCVQERKLNYAISFLFPIIFIIPASFYLFARPKRKKPKVSLYALSVLVILISLLFMANAASNLFASFSKDSVDSSATIILNKEVATQLTELYNQNPDDEFLVCLKGKSAKGRYQIDNIDIPETLIKTPIAISYAPCTGPNLLGTIRSNPYGNCELSNRDIFDFSASNSLLTAIMCESNTYAFFTSEDLEYKMYYVIRDTSQNITANEDKGVTALLTAFKPKNKD